ncbi:MAG: hypothetical protein WAM78_21775 [Candidatus Sulfotelmatobacter sp.]
MHPDTRQIAEHMKDFGLCLLGRSVVDVAFAEIMNPYSHAMGAIRCAHAAEIIIKARIAEEHPLLIFAKLPKPTPESNDLLSINELLDEGRTLMYNELPDALWAATGYRIPDLKRFQDFGKRRNMLTHLAVPPEVDLPRETLGFAFQVMQPMINDFWKSDIFEYIGQYDPDANEDGYIYEQLEMYKIPFVRKQEE